MRKRPSSQEAEQAGMTTGETLGFSAVAERDRDRSDPPVAVRPAVTGVTKPSAAPSVTARVAIEQASTFDWHRWVGATGIVIGMSTVGASAPLKALQNKVLPSPPRRSSLPPTNKSNARPTQRPNTLALLAADVASRLTTRPRQSLLDGVIACNPVDIDPAGSTCSVPDTLAHWNATQLILINCVA